MVSRMYLSLYSFPTTEMSLTFYGYMDSGSFKGSSCFLQLLLFTINHDLVGCG